MPDLLMGISKFDPSKLLEIRGKAVDELPSEFVLWEYYHGRGVKATIERALKAQGLNEKVGVSIMGEENNYYQLAEGVEKAPIRTLPSSSEKTATTFSYTGKEPVFSAAAIYFYRKEDGQKVKYR